MRKTILTMLIITVVLLGGCFTETIDQFSTFKFQSVLFFMSTHENKAAPDTSWDFSNLFKYKEYKDNVGKIKTSMIVQFNYWIDELIYKDDEGNLYTLVQDSSITDEEGHPKAFMQNLNDLSDQNHPEIIFDFVRFYLVFAKHRDGNTDYENYIDSSWYDRDYDYTGSPNGYLLGEYNNVDVIKYYRQAYHIIEVQDDVAKIISDAVNDRPVFYIRTEYSPIKGQRWEPPYTYEMKSKFPWVKARYDMIIRFEVEL